MYEGMTFEYLMERALSRVDNSIDRRQGSIIYDAIAPSIVEISMMYIELDRVINQAFADTADREFLIKRAKERDLSPKKSTSAEIKAEMNIKVAEGTRFNLGELNYKVTDYIGIQNSRFTYRLGCESGGVKGNITGRLTPIENVPDLNYCVATELLVLGKDEEGTEAFRQRYFESLNTYAFGGNVADYKNKAMNIAGVGGVKIWTSNDSRKGGIVEVYIQSTDYTEPSDELVDEVQELFDPLDGQGKGLGLAPIGHEVTVLGAWLKSVDISATITYEDGFGADDIVEVAKDEIRKYFDELNENWANVPSIIVKRSRIWYIFSEIDGVKNVNDVKINEMDADYEIEREILPEVGDIDV